MRRSAWGRRLLNQRCWRCAIGRGWGTALFAGTLGIDSCWRARKYEGSETEQLLGYDTPLPMNSSSLNVLEQLQVVKSSYMSGRRSDAEVALRGILAVEPKN